MSSIAATPPPSEDAPPGGGSRIDPFEALCRLIRRGQGRFVLALVEYNLPRERDAVLDRLQGTFSDLNVVSVALTPPPADAPRTLNVLDQLDSLVRTASPERKPDVLLITGYETLFPDVEGPAAEGPGASEQLARAIQPLNLGRNVLAKMFPCPVVLFLPSPAMAVFLRSAPDLSSWRSGFFPFHADPDQVRAELAQAAAAGVGWWERRRLHGRPPPYLHAEAHRLEALIADAAALPAQKTVTARLLGRLGWVCVALGSRTQARGAFAEMMRLAREADDAGLLRAAERGQRAAERVTTARAEASPERAEAARQVFRGAAALTEAEGLYGREEELLCLLVQVASDTAVSRFQTVWGETGCGKSSLVQAGLIPELEKLGRYLPVVVRQWSAPEAALRQALEQASGVSPDPSASLHDALRQVAEQTGKTVVAVCDQFEQFFASRSRRSQCEPFLKAVGDCVGDFRIPCKFLFVVREDELGRMAGFDNYVTEPLEQAKRFYLPLFSADDAVRVLRQQSDAAGLGWPDAFLRTVVADLTRDGRVRPIELQLVGAALAASGINNDLDYARAGRAQGLLADYLDLVLTDSMEWSRLTQRALRRGVLKTSSVRIINIFRLPFLLGCYIEYLRRSSVRDMKRILLALVADPPGRLSATLDEIARSTNLEPNPVRRKLAFLTEVHLARPVADPLSTTRYELTHDILVDLVLAVTRDLQDNRRRANRVLRRALEDCVINPRHTIGLRDWRLVKRNIDEEERARPRARALLRRSLLWGGFKWFVLPPAGIVLLLAFVQCTYGYVNLERDFAERIVIRRGLPWLGFLPVLGDAVVLDTGLTVADLQRERQVRTQGMLHWEWGNQRSEALELLAENMTPVEQGSLWCEIGQGKKGIPVLLEALQSSDRDVRFAAADALGQAACAEPDLALAPLLQALQHSDSNVRSVAANALGQAAHAEPGLASKLLNPLLQALQDSDSEVRSAAADALGQAARPEPGLAGKALVPLVKSLQDSEWLVRTAAADALGQAARADPRLASKLFAPLLEALQDSDRDVRTAAADALGLLARAEPRLATRVLAPLLKARLQALQHSDSNVRSAAADALGLLARADPRQARELLDSLLQALQDTDREVRTAAARASVQAARADPRLASKVLNPLLQALQDSDRRVRFDAAGALGQALRADPGLASKMFAPLLQALQNSDSFVRFDAAGALIQAARADPRQASKMLDSLLQALQDTDREVRSKVAGALGQAARADAKLQKQVFQLLTDYDEGVREGVRDPLADLLVERLERQTSPARLLLDHLEGRLSLMPAASNLPEGGNANTFAGYRDVVIGALARWLASDDPKAKAEQPRLREELQRLRGDGRLHLRIAAWKVLVEAAELRERKERGREED